jgi:hypothetical protein
MEVESSAISALGYEVSRLRLAIEFQKKRQVYVYYEVPHSEFKASLAANRKDVYLTLIVLQRSIAVQAHTGAAAKRHTNCSEAPEQHTFFLSRGTSYSSYHLIYDRRYILKTLVVQVRRTGRRASE